MTDIELIEDLCHLKHKLRGEQKWEQTAQDAVIRIIQLLQENAVGKTANIINNLNAKIIDLSKQLEAAKAEPRLDAEDVNVEASFNEDGTPATPPPAAPAAQ